MESDSLETGGANPPATDSAAASAFSAKEKSFLRQLDAFFDAHGLKPFSKRTALAYIQQMATEDAENFERVSLWLIRQLNGTRRLPEGFSDWQLGCPGLVPRLRSKSFWDTSELGSWVKDLEGSFEAIRGELLALRGLNAFRPYRAPSSSNKALTAVDGVGSTSTDSGEWNVYYLFLHNMPFEENQSRCPLTCAAISSVSAQYHHAFFSALAPGTHITKHHGPTNKKLRCHLPLVVPEGKCRLRVGDDVRELVEGECIVFDDSYEHEAWNDDPASSRLVLILDVWHPDLRPKEVKFLDFLQQAALKAEKQMVEARDAESMERGIYDNFFSVIEAAKALPGSDEKVF